MVSRVTGSLIADPIEGQPPVVVPSISVRYKAPGLLCLGTTSALCGFVGSFLCVLIDFLTVKESEVLQVEFASGHGYWPETVSESVANKNSAAGKIFFTFCLIAGILFFISWYPYSLRNVYTGPETMVCGLLYSITFRQYVPYIGLLMLLGVTTYPSAIASQVAGGQLCVMLHLLGAGMMFVGYMFAEFHCLEMLCFKHKQEIDKKYLSIEGAERRIRQYFAAGTGVFFVVFLVFQVLLTVVPEGPRMGQADKWMLAGEWYPLHKPNTTIITHNVLQVAKYSDTATGGILLFKMGSYFSECLAGVFLLMSHFAIYYFCEERHVDYGVSELEMVFDDMDTECEDDF